MISDGQATTSIDQLRRINPDGSGDELIAGNFAANAPGNIALDKANNLMIVADVRATAPEILKVDLSTIPSSTASSITSIPTTFQLTGIAVLPTCTTFVTTLTPDPSGTLTCARTSLTLTATGGSSYVFARSGGGGIVSQSTSGSAVINASGTYSVTVTSADGCTMVNTTTVSSNTTSPSVTINPISGTLTCTVTSLTLTASGNGTSYLWTGNTTGATRVVSTTGTYSVTATGANGCTATASVAVSQNVTLPTPGLVASGTLTCASTAVTLTASGGNSYTFAGTGIMASAGNSATVNQVGTFSVVVTAVNGCTALATTTVQSNTTTPSASLVASGTITCSVPTVTLTASGGVSYRLSNGQSNTTGVFVVSSAGAYSVTVTGPNGCTATANALVVADQNVPTLSINGSSTFCEGTTSSLKATGNGTFRWNTGETTPTLSVSVTGTYSLTLTAPNGCTVEASQLVTAVSCTTAAPPTLTCGSPQNTLGQALLVTGVTDINCQTGSFRILTTGGNGQPINYAGIVGLNSMNPYNCVRMVDGPDLVRAINNPSSDLKPFGLRGVQVGGSTSNVFMLNLKGYCTGQGRQSASESLSELAIMVLGNPSLGASVEVIVSNTGGQPLQWRVMSAEGQVVGHGHADSTGNEVHRRVGLGHSSGVYLLQVSTSTQSKTVKIIRQ